MPPIEVSSEGHPLKGDQAGLSDQASLGENRPMLKCDHDAT